MQIRCYGVKLVHVAHLLSLMHQFSPNYHPANFNGWWFAVGSSDFRSIRACHSFSFYTVGIGALRHLMPENDWSKHPGRKWIESSGDVMSRTLLGNSTTTLVTREFFKHWNVRKHVDFTKPESWGAQRQGSPTFPADQPESLEDSDDPVAQFLFEYADALWSSDTPLTSANNVSPEPTPYIRIVQESTEAGPSEPPIFGNLASSTENGIDESSSADSGEGLTSDTDTPPSSQGLSLSQHGSAGMSQPLDLF